MRNRDLNPASLELTKKSAFYIVEIMNAMYPTNRDWDTFEVGPDMEEGSFDVNRCGEQYEGGSYMVEYDGTIKIVSLGNLPMGDEVLGNVNYPDYGRTKLAFEKLDNL